MTAQGAWAVGALLVLSACHDKTVEPSAADGRDQATLLHVVSADESFDEAMKAADDAERGGDDARAVALLTGDATKAADDALATATGAPLETDWAKQRRDSLVAVLRARRDSIAPYAKALGGEDLEAKLGAVRTQLELQKWAMDAAQAALAPPGPASMPPSPALAPTPPPR